MSMTIANLGVVIVTYNNEIDLPHCLDALQVNAAGAHVVVRDCGSSDGTTAVARQHPAVDKVIPGANIGFGAASNDAVRGFDRTVEMILFLNPDAIVDCDLSELLKHIEQLGEFGCVGIQQRSLEGDLVWSWDLFPTPALEWQKARRMPLHQRSPAGYTEDRRVEWNMGAFMLIPLEAFQAVEGFDERFFLFYEEIDLCQRLAAVGRPTYYVNKFQYRHDRSDKATLWREVLRLNSRREYDRKWLSGFATLQCQLAQSYRWLHDAVRPSRPRDRRLVVPRLLATWNLIRAIVPPDSIGADIDSWQAVRPFWKS